MNRNIMKSLLIASILVGSATFGLKACAQDMPYEPVFENVPITESITSAAKSEVSETKSVSSMTPVKHETVASATTTAPANTATTTPVETSNLQSALMQLDSAQIELRNQLIQYKSEYASIDNQYKAIGKERAAKAKLVKETEKKIKNLDSTKEKIRKNMD